MVTRLIVVIISQCMKISNHYVVHLKLIVLYVSYTAIKKINPKKRKRKDISFKTKVVGCLGGSVVRHLPLAGS